MNCFLVLLVVSAQQNLDTIDETLLKSVHDTIVSRYSAISNLKCESSAHWETIDSPLVDEAIKSIAKKRKHYDALSNPSGTTTAPTRPFSNKKHWKETLYYSPPNLRLDKKFINNDEIAGNDNIAYVFYKNKFTQINFDQGNVTKNDSKSVDINSVFSFGILQSLGILVQGTTNQSFHELLTNKEYCYKESDDRYALVLRIGPNIPVGIRPPGSSDDFYIRATLNKEMDYFPVRLEYHLSNKVIHTSTAEDFVQCNDVKRNKSVYMPELITYKDSIGFTTWKIQNLVLNSLSLNNEIEPKIPEGFITHKAGEGPKRTVLHGGSDAAKLAAETSAKSAKRLLEEVPPSGDSGEGWGILRIALPITLSFALILLIVSRLSRRKQDVS